MSAEHMIWATFQPVDEPMQKLALLALADGRSASACSIAEYYHQPTWNFGPALEWLAKASLIMVDDDITYFNFGSGPGTTRWVDGCGCVLGEEPEN